MDKKDNLHLLIKFRNKPELSQKELAKEMDFMKRKMQEYEDLKKEIEK